MEKEVEGIKSFMLAVAASDDALMKKIDDLSCQLTKKDIPTVDLNEDQLVSLILLRKMGEVLGEKRLAELGGIAKTINDDAWQKKPTLERSGSIKAAQPQDSGQNEDSFGSDEEQEHEEEEKKEEEARAKIEKRDAVTMPNGDVYTGEWLGNVRQGRGVQLVKEDGSKYEGTFFNDQYCGHGKYTYVDGDVYEGSWRNGMANGYGVYYNA